MLCRDGWAAYYLPFSMLLRMACGIASGAFHNWIFSASIFIGMYALDMIVSSWKFCLVKDVGVSLQCGLLRNGWTWEHNLQCRLISMTCLQDVTWLTKLAGHRGMLSLYWPCPESDRIGTGGITSYYHHFWLHVFARRSTCRLCRVYLVLDCSFQSWCSTCLPSFGNIETHLLDYSAKKEEYRRGEISTNFYRCVHKQLCLHYGWPVHSDRSLVQTHRGFLPHLEVLFMLMKKAWYQITQRIGLFLCWVLTRGLSGRRNFRKTDFRLWMAKLCYQVRLRHIVMSHCMTDKATHIKSLMGGIWSSELILKVQLESEALTVEGSCHCM